jgi:hypothetical protein
LELSRLRSIPHRAFSKEGRFLSLNVQLKGFKLVKTTLASMWAWMTAPTEEALKLQRPLSDGSLKIVARGSKQDGNPELLSEVGLVDSR